jgi:hypothetical protein
MIPSTPPQSSNSFRPLDDSPKQNGQTTPPGISITPASGLYGQLGLFEVSVDGAVQYMTQDDIDAAGYGAPSPAPAPAPAPAPDWKPKHNDDIVFVGMNTGAAHEVNELRKLGARVTFIKDAPKDDQIRVGKITYDLSKPDGAKAFAATLGLPADQTEKIADAISNAEPDSRDELAQLAQVWAKAEKGGQIPSRLMLSGHSGGNSVWGDGNGRLTFESIEKLAAAMPRAASSIEDLHLAACSTGQQTQMDHYRAMFPNVKTIWAYTNSDTGSAPGAFEGATTHERLWEKATRGDKDTLDRTIAISANKGNNVAVWTASGGYDNGLTTQASLADARAAVDSGRDAFTRAWSGEVRIKDPQHGPLRDYYNNLQPLVHHRDLPVSERGPLEAEREQTLRLLYYSAKIAPKFAQVHRNEIKTGYESLGLKVPNFAKMSRKDALENIARFEQALAGATPPPQAAQDLLPLLTEGLRDLDSLRIPENWI